MQQHARNLPQNRLFSPLQTLLECTVVLLLLSLMEDIFKGQPTTFPAVVIPVATILPCPAASASQDSTIAVLCTHHLVLVTIDRLVSDSLAVTPIGQSRPPRNHPTRATSMTTSSHLISFLRREAWIHQYTCLLPITSSQQLNQVILPGEWPVTTAGDAQFVEILHPLRKKWRRTVPIYDWTQH